VPSLIINSGNGFGLFWELAEPVTVTAENLEDIKARNVALADQLGARTWTASCGCRTRRRSRRAAVPVHEPRTWFDLQGAAAYLAVREQTLSRYVKENTAPPSVKVGNGRTETLL
jgi:hypothetical protein